MAKLLVGIEINNEYTDSDFEINLADEEMEGIKYLYKRALEKSGMDEETFGPTYYEQLKKEDRNLADMLETAVLVRLETIMRSNSTEDCVQAMKMIIRQDKDGNYYQVFALENKIDIDLTDFPRIEKTNL